MSIRVTSLKMMLDQGGSHGVTDHILMVLQCQGQRVVERSMNSSVGSKSDTVEGLAKPGKRRVSYSSLGITTHSSLATLVEKEDWGLLQSSTEVHEGANTMVEAAS